MATNLPLFPRRLQLPVLVTVRSVCVRLSRTIQGPKSQPESCFGRMCLSPVYNVVGVVKNCFMRLEADLELREPERGQGRPAKRDV